MGQGPPSGPEMIWKAEVGRHAGPRPDQGVELGFGRRGCRRSGGVARGARAPSRKWSLKWEKGSWGMSSATVVSWPVTGSGFDLQRLLDEDPQVRVLEDHVEGEEGAEGVLVGLGDDRASR